MLMKLMRLEKQLNDFSIGGSYNGITFGCYPNYVGSIPTPSANFSNRA